MEITLKKCTGHDDEGKPVFVEKTYVAPFISARMFRRTLEITKKTDFNDIDDKALDTLVDYVVDVYGKQFTRDDFYDGIEAKKLVPTVLDCINEVSGRTDETVGLSDDPNS